MQAAQLSTHSFQRLSQGGHAVALALASLMVVLLLVSGAYAQSSEPEEAGAVGSSGREEAEPAKSVIIGKAVYDDTGRPVRRANIMLIDLVNMQQSPDKYATATDGNGKFRIQNVTAGSYLVMIDAPGVLTPMAFMNLEETRAPTPADMAEARKHFDEVVVDGTNEVKVEVRARRGGAISGKVTYRDGDAAVNVIISVIRKSGEGNGRFLSGFNAGSLLGMHTDDRGMYRIAGLPPGEYLVSAAESNTNIQDDGSQSAPGHGMDRFMRDIFASDALAVTYYGDARTARDATTVKVEAGEEESDINISLIEHQNYVVGGTLASKRGHRPLNRATLKLRSKEDYGGLFATDRTTQTDEQGNWLFRGVPDGTYLITIEPPYETTTTTATTATTSSSTDVEEQRPAPPVARRLSRKQQEVTVQGSDITTLAIELGEGASISGTLTFEGGKKSVGYTSIGIERIDGLRVNESAYAVVDPDSGTFNLEGLLAGELFLTATVYQNNNYYVKSITANGRDLLREPLKLNESDEIRGVQIVMSSQVATLSGRVMDNPNGTPRGGVLLTLIPNAAQRWRAQSGRLYARTDGAGEFKLSGPPGEYLVFVWPPDKAAELFNESYIRTHAASAQRVTMQPGSRQTADFLLPGQQN